MKRLTTLAISLSCLILSSAASAQNIGLTFDEAGTALIIDGRVDLIPNPDLFNFDSAVVWVIAYDIPEVFGYEYGLTSTDASATVSAPVIWPAEGSNFATLPGDVRVGTGICFAAGDAQAGPDPTHIRLAKHQFTWFSPPVVNVFYCIHPSAASVQATGATAPQYTECVSNPVSLPFGIHNSYRSGISLPEGCAVILFAPESGWGIPATCEEAVAARDRSWGALKAAY